VTPYLFSLLSPPLFNKSIFKLSVTRVLTMLVLFLLEEEEGHRRLLVTLGQGLLF